MAEDAARTSGYAACGTASPRPRPIRPTGWMGGCSTAATQAGHPEPGDSTHAAGPARDAKGGEGTEDA
ncbi:hypothetical protein GCM10010392_32820 [Streptomyces clavifer]|nr:hypothetical protein GCM10010392_32820 [Streptomyces clavifer]